jgi:hypothetical protein
MERLRTKGRCMSESDKNTDKKERRERIKNEERERNAECAMRRERQ